MNVAGYYHALAARRSQILSECVADPDTFALQVASHNTLKDFELMLNTVSGPEQVVFMQACREYQYALEAVIFGNYRHAFSSLRLAFEFFSAAIYFSAHQMKLQLWLKGHDDLWWSTLTDSDKGVFSESFMRAFNPDLRQYRTQYAALAATVYRECSEYVHGNPGTHEDTAADVSYDQSRIRDFHDKVSTVRLCVIFQFVSRYLLGLNPSQRTSIESLILDSFGNLPEIQAVFEASAT